MTPTLKSTLALFGFWAATLVSAATLSHDQARAGLAATDAMDRFVAVERLAELGDMADADAVLQRLADTDPRVRLSAGNAIWQIWSRSGDTAIDELLTQGVMQMQAGATADALTTFNEVVQRRPAFAEGWNKRATLRYLMGDWAQSMQDCEEVFKRNPRHFGALAGAGQIQLRLGRPDLALNYFRLALAVNPNLEGPAQMIPLLEKHLQDLEKNKT